MPPGKEKNHTPTRAKWNTYTLALPYLEQLRGCGFHPEVGTWDGAFGLTPFTLPRHPTYGRSGSFRESSIFAPCPYRRDDSCTAPTGYGVVLRPGRVGHAWSKAVRQFELWGSRKRCFLRCTPSCLSVGHPGGGIAYTGARCKVARSYLWSSGTPS